VAVSGHGGAAGVVTNWYPSARNNDYVHLSKLYITASQSSGNLDTEPLNGINAVSHGRVVGVAITGPTVYGGYGGAIAGTEGHAEGGTYLGVYIHHYGLPTHYSYNWDDSTWTSSPYTYSNGTCTNCTSVDRFQHLYYINHRVSNTQGEAYEIGWNHLTDNPILSGIHIYDMGDSGGWSGTMKIHHNVIKNQRGGSIDCINTGSAGVTHLDVYNNLIIIDANESYNHGRAFDFGAAVIKFYNNTVYGYSWPNQLDGSNVDFRNNIMVDNRDNVSLTSHTPSTSSNNIFNSTGSTTKPAWVTTTANPLFNNAGSYDFSLQTGSPAINAGYNTTATVATDFLGQPRTAGSVSIGAFEDASSVSDTTAPSAPSGLSVR
jgi:hypothetical protein